jgi:hypothetical protein
VGADKQGSSDVCAMSSQACVCSAMVNLFEQITVCWPFAQFCGIQQ